MSNWIHRNGGKGRALVIPTLSRLEAMRGIIRDLISHLPAHPNAHGYVKGRSVESCLAPHLGCKYLLHLDLCHFFRSTSRHQVAAGLELYGVEPQTREAVLNLCFEDGFLPIGPPTSPALSNVAMYVLDSLLCGEQTYTRYSDQLLFSGQRPPDEGGIRWLIREWDYRINERKSWLRVRGRQSLEVMGWVIGETHLTRSRRYRRHERAIRHLHPNGE